MRRFCCIEKVMMTYRLSNVTEKLTLTSTKLQIHADYLLLFSLKINIVQYAFQKCVKGLDASAQYKCLCLGSMSNDHAATLITWDFYAAIAVQ